jgi:hypothetical protein
MNKEQQKARIWLEFHHHICCTGSVYFLLRVVSADGRVRAAGPNHAVSLNTNKGLKNE